MTVTRRHSAINLNYIITYFRLQHFWWQKNPFDPNHSLLSLIWMNSCQLIQPSSFGVVGKFRISCTYQCVGLSHQWIELWVSPVPVFPLPLYNLVELFKKKSTISAGSSVPVMKYYRIKALKKKWQPKFVAGTAFPSTVSVKCGSALW